MAFNVMDMITDQLTPDNVGVLSKFLGEDSALVTKAISAAAPILLNGILVSTSKSAGRDLFNKSIDQADSGLLGNLTGALTSSGGNSMASSGLSMLTSLFGDNKRGSLIKSISSFSGLSSGSSKSLLSLAAPLLMSMLSKRKQDYGLDNNGLLGMLSSQKKNIAKAITPDMNRAFSDLGLLDGLVDEAGNTAKTATQTMTKSTQQAASESKFLFSKSQFSKLLPYIAIALIAWLAYQFFMQPTQEEAVTQTTRQSAKTMTQALSVGNKNLGKSLVEVFDHANQTLSGVTDANSANAALNSLVVINQRIDSIVRLASQLSPEGKQMLATITGKMSLGLDKSIEQVYKVPGAGSILGNSINTLRQQLAALANL